MCVFVPQVDYLEQPTLPGLMPKTMATQCRSAVDNAVDETDIFLGDRQVLFLSRNIEMAAPQNPNISKNLFIFLKLIGLIGPVFVLKHWDVDPYCRFCSLSQHHSTSTKARENRKKQVHPRFLQAQPGRCPQRGLFFLGLFARFAFGHSISSQTGPGVVRPSFPPSAQLRKCFSFGL